MSISTQVIDLTEDQQKSFEFLIDKSKPNSRAHIWTGVDTACKLWSTSNINKKKPSWVIRSRYTSRKVCVMCCNVAGLVKLPRYETTEQIVEEQRELEFLRWYIAAVDNELGPASDDVYAILKAQYKQETGKEPPRGY